MAAQREWFEKDYYKVLGVVSTATDKEITRAYRKLAKQYHPDANPGSEDRFKEISAAYDVLVKEGLERLDEAAVPFDPAIHDAVAHTEGEPGDTETMVDEVLRSGYRWKGQALRPAMVRVRG